MDLPHDNKISELSKFEGCETIIGNINLMGLKDPDGSKLAFFSSVKKITGYIAVINSEMPYLPFQNIQIISGQNLIKAKKLFKYALFIRGTNVTEYAGLNELMEISNGDVMVEENNDILTGFMNTIHWKDILMNNSSMPAIIPRGGSLMNIQSCKFLHSWIFKILTNCLPWFHFQTETSAMWTVHTPEGAGDPSTRAATKVNTAASHYLITLSGITFHTNYLLIFF